MYIAIVPWILLGVCHIAVKHAVAASLSMRTIGLNAYNSSLDPNLSNHLKRQVGGCFNCMGRATNHIIEGPPPRGRTREENEAHDITTTWNYRNWVRTFETGTQEGTSGEIGDHGAPRLDIHTEPIPFQAVELGGRRGHWVHSMTRHPEGSEFHWTTRFVGTVDDFSNAATFWRRNHWWSSPTRIVISWWLEVRFPSTAEQPAEPIRLLPVDVDNSRDPLVVAGTGWFIWHEGGIGRLDRVESSGPYVYPNTLLHSSSFQNIMVVWKMVVVT